MQKVENKWCEAEQGTDEWKEDRAGKITGSLVKELLTNPRGKSEKFSSSAKTYIEKILSERLTGTTEEIYANRAMQWGTEHEDEAIYLYEEKTMMIVERVGFYKENEFLGCSLDGYSNKLIQEVKCLSSKNHLKILMSGEVPKEHLSQCLFNMVVVGAKFCDFIAYDPRYINPKHRLIVVTIDRNDYKEEIANIFSRVGKAIKEVKRLEKELNE